MTPDKGEVRTLANVLRNTGYQRMLPEDLATHLLTNGYSRTSLTVDQVLDAVGGDVDVPVG